MKINFAAHKSFAEEPEESLETQFFVKILDEGVLFAPGTFFSAEHLEEKSEGHLRISFSDASVGVFNRFHFRKLMKYAIAGEHA